MLFGCQGRWPNGSLQKSLYFWETDDLKLHCHCLIFAWTKLFSAVQKTTGSVSGKFTSVFVCVSWSLIGGSRQNEIQIKFHNTHTQLQVCSWQEGVVAQRKKGKKNKKKKASRLGYFPKTPFWTIIRESKRLQDMNWTRFANQLTDHRGGRIC